jgi:hypothetical protein
VPDRAAHLGSEENAPMLNNSPQFPLAHTAN